MAVNDSIKSYTNAADITNYLIEQIAPRYFNMENVNTYRSGTLGFITDAISTVTEDTHHGIMIARREFYPNTAQYTKSLYRHAASRFMDIPMGTPAQANVLLMLQQSEILKYGKKEGDLHTFVLDDTFIAHVGEIPFMLDYPITILSMQRSNGKYAHTTHYDLYIKNSLSTSNERYLPNKVLMYKAAEYIIIAARMRQVYKKYDSFLVSTNAAITTVTHDFPFSGTLANFEVFYKENDRTPRVQLEKRLVESGISKKPFCWYTVIDNETIRLQFPANAYFVPRMNSTISIEIFTTLGEGGNFDVYDSDIVSENASTRYPYNTQVPVFGTVDGASINGANTIEKEEFRTQVVMAYCTNHTYISVHDLQLYFNQLMIGTPDSFKFVKKRDDAFVRLYGAFLLMKDNANNVIPSNTLDIDLDPLHQVEDFDIYGDAVRRYIIKPGALFTYRRDKNAIGRKQYILRRLHNKYIYDDLKRYDEPEGVWHCTKCGYEHTGPEDIPKEQADPMSTFHCPRCGGSKNRFANYRFIFCNPYLISISTDTFMAGYFLNSLEDHHDLSYTAVNDLSIVQFIAKHFKIERNAILGENFYRFSVAISPSVDIPWDTVYEERNESIIAPYDGYLQSLIREEDAVYATVKYTWDPVNLELPPEEERTQRIQVSSYLTKIDETYYICPTCGHRMSVEEWESAQEAGFLNDDETIMMCPHCQEIELEDNAPAQVETFEKTYIDYEYTPGFMMNLKVGEEIIKGDEIATARPKDLGRIRLVMDLGDVMSSAVHRYIPMTIEEVHNATNRSTGYFIFAAYISTTDMIDSRHIMSITDGYAMQDGSSGHTKSLAIPIAGLGMKLHAFYEYREDDELEEATRNPSHQFSSYHYMAGRTFTNTYELQTGDSITLVKALDNAKGFLDAIERIEDDDDIDDSDPGDIPPNPDDPPGGHPGYDPDDDHPVEEWEDLTDDPTNSVYLRTNQHEKFLAVCDTDDRIPGYHLTVQMTEEQKKWQEENKPGGGGGGGNEGNKPKPDPDEEEEGIKPIIPPPIYEPDDPKEYGSSFTFRLRNCPLLAANWIKDDTNEELFIEKITQHYAEIERVLWDLENAFSIDLKFYNSYGKSKFYKIGNGPGTNLERLDSVNITLSFGVALDFLATADVFRDQFRTFVQKQIEATDDMVGNGIDIYIMNIVAAAKAEFDQIIYLEYYGLNNYDFSAQRLVIMSDDEILKRVPADSFVPEFLNVIREETSDGLKPKVKTTIIRGELDK